MALPKKYKVLRDVEYGTFAEHDANHVITKTDARRYLPGEAIELSAKDAEGLLASGAIGEFDAKPKDEPKPEEPKAEDKKGGK